MGLGAREGCYVGLVIRQTRQPVESEALGRNNQQESSRSEFTKCYLFSSYGRGLVFP